MKRLRTAVLVPTAAALVALAGAAAGQDSELTYSGSLQFVSGDYSLSETTRTILLFNGLLYRQGKWSFSANIPFIDQDSPFVTYSGGVPVPSGRRLGVEGDDGGAGTGGSGQGSGMGPGGTVIVPDPDTLTFNQSGVGDPVLRADLTVSEGGATGPRVGVYATAKPPLADGDSGFGTGEWDYGAGVTLSKKAGAALVLADFGYWTLGDLPDLELQDPFAYSLGLGRSTADGRYSLLGSISGMTEIVAGVEGPVQVGITVSRLLESKRSLISTLAAGLTESSPDYSVSVGWRMGSP